MQSATNGYANAQISIRSIAALPQQQCGKVVPFRREYQQYLHPEAEPQDE
jgi:hypothetical protein